MTYIDKRGGSNRGSVAALGLFSIALATAGALPTRVAAQSQPQAAAPAAQAQPAAKVAKTPAKKKAAAAEADDGAPPLVATKKDPAEAVRQVEGGIKLMQANKTEQGIQTLSVAIASGVLPPTQMARALYNRGAGYRRSGKPAQAIADLTSALYVKNGLPDADRADAVKQRAEAYREAGLPDQTTDDGRPAGAIAPRRSASAAGSSGASTAPLATASLAPSATVPTAPASGGLLATLFGGLGKSQPAAAAQPAPTQSAAVVGAVSQPATSGWSSASTTVRPARTPSAAGAATTVVTAPVVAPAPAASVKVASAAATATPSGAYHARIALVRNEAEAQPVLQRLKTELASALAGKTASAVPAQFGGMGTFVQVRIGPYASMAEANAACARLKGSKLDCVAVDR